MPFGRVGVAAVDQRADHVNDLADVLCGARLDIRFEYTEGGDVGPIFGRESIGQRANRLSVGKRRRIDLVVDVRDVMDVLDVLEVKPQHSRQDIERDLGQRVADMRQVVDGGAADVHRHRVGNAGFKPPLGTGQRVVNIDVHRLVRSEVGCGQAPAESLN